MSILDLLGCARVSDVVEKGDKPGHPFYGNQHTGGGKGGGASSVDTSHSISHTFSSQREVSAGMRTAKNELVGRGYSYSHSNTRVGGNNSAVQHTMVNHEGRTATLTTSQNADRTWNLTVKLH